MTWDVDTPPRAVDEPQPGFFRLRLVRGAPWTACRLERDACGLWRAFVNEVLQGPPHADPWRVPGLERIWTGAEQIEELEYRHLIRLHDWAVRHDRTHPAANPSRPYDPHTAAPRF